MASAPSVSFAQSPPAGFVVENAFPSAVFDSPDQLTFLPDGRFLVTEVGGRVWTILANGTQVATPFLDIRPEVAGFSDLGMLGTAVDPDFAQADSMKHWVYFGYTVDPNGDDIDNDLDHFVRVVRYRASTANPDVADTSTRQVLIGATWTEGILTSHTSHSIGALRFAPDKTLLIACGEGAHHEVPSDSGGLDAPAFIAGRTDPAEDMGAFRARSLNCLGGKILRVDKETGFGLSSNPWWDGNGASHRSRVWLYGFRNPYRWCFRPGTGSTNPATGNPGTIYIGDVGMNTFEEMDVAPTGGLNFGWPCYEGAPTQPDYQLVTTTHTGNLNPLCGAASNSENPLAQTVTSPKIWWHHFDGNQSSLAGWGIGSCGIGGTFYSGTSYPAAYQGRYFVADLFGDWIRKVDVDANNNVTGWSEFVTSAGGPVDIEPQPSTGDLFYIAYFPEQVKRIRHTGGVAAPLVAESVTQLAAQTAPNPFREGTLIRFSLPDARDVAVAVFDVRGRVVRRFASAHFAAGSHVVEWDGRDESGARVPRGTYFYRVETGRGSVSGKVVSIG